MSQAPSERSALQALRGPFRGAGAPLMRLIGKGPWAKAPWVPVGGVHIGMAFVGTVGEEPHIELTALGDPVNVTPRLASGAGAGEILVTYATAQAARLHEDGMGRRDLDLKGKNAPTTVLVLTG